MITKFDIDTAIAECQGKAHPDAKTCIMLAAFLTIRKEMFSNDDMRDISRMTAYSYAAPPKNQSVGTITYQSDSEFSRLIQGRNINTVLSVFDYLMSTLQALHPRLYHSVLQKIDEE